MINSFPENITYLSLELVLFIRFFKRRAVYFSFSFHFSYCLVFWLLLFPIFVGSAIPNGNLHTQIEKKQKPKHRFFFIQMNISGREKLTSYEARMRHIKCKRLIQYDLLSSVYFCLGKKKSVFRLVFFLLWFSSFFWF